MNIKFSCSDGSQTRAKSALCGLMYWNMRFSPPPPPIPEEFLGKVVLQDTGQKVIGPDTPQLLLDICVATCERQWNKTPKLYGESLEDRALSFLKWLRGIGDITYLEVDGEECGI
jgi:hypothetical protein